MATQLKAFVDVNVWYSAANKSTGHARQVVSGSLPNLKLITSERIISSARKYLEKNASSRLNILDVLIESLGKNLQIISEPNDEIILKSFEDVLDADDAAVLAGARQSNADYLVTWNTKDFIQDKISDITIVTPAELIDKL